jgi:hypothetical protein
MTRVVPGMVPATHSPPTVRTQVADGAAWLKELERARWEAQPRYRPGEAGQRGQAQQPQVLAGTSAGAGVAMAGITPERWSRQGRAIPVTEAAAQLPPSERLPAGTGSPVLRACDAFIPGLAGERLLPIVERIRQELLRTARKPSPGLPEHTWSQRHVHVQADGDGCAVWIRDAEISPDQLRAVLQAVARVAADSGAGRAVRLTVNGRPVVDATPPCNPLASEGERNGN